MLVQKKYNLLITNVAIIFAITINNIACKKLVEVKVPNNQLVKNVVFSDDRTSIAVLNTIMTTISYGAVDGLYLPSIPLITGLSGDEMIIFNTALNKTLTGYFQNNLDQNNISSVNIWKASYTVLYKINDAIEGISNSTSLTESVRKQLIGEAKFWRSYCYFYLVNLYGDVPLILTTDYTKNSLIGNSNQSEIWKQIISDLNEAKDLLSDNFLDGLLMNPTTERVRPTKWAASALLAKAYLYNKNWAMAEEESTIVISNTATFNLSSLNEVFKRNSSEAILQSQPLADNFNTAYAPYYVIPSGSAPTFSHPIYLSDHLLKSFENGDLRKSNWINSSIASTGITYYYPFKYQSYKEIRPTDELTEYTMILRLSEQYLIRSEARAQQGKLSLALEDLKIIRNRAGLDAIFSNDQTSLIDSILHERQVELFAEWGDRWLDLKRTNKIDQVMTIVTQEKGGVWNNYKKYYPIDGAELLFSPNIKQTPGYQK